MSPSQTRSGAVGAGWPSKRLGAAHRAGSESVVRGTKERGCWARKPWVASARRMRPGLPREALEAVSAATTDWITEQDGLIA